MRRAFLHDIAVVDQLPQVVGDVRSEIAAAQRQFAYRHLGIPDVEQHHPLHVVDVVDGEPIGFEFGQPPVKPLDQRDNLKGNRSS
jgi:hypothetical protein